MSFYIIYLLAENNSKIYIYVHRNGSVGIFKNKNPCSAVYTKKDRAKKEKPRYMLIPIISCSRHYFCFKKMIRE